MMDTMEGPTPSSRHYRLHWSHTIDSIHYWCSQEVGDFWKCPEFWLQISANFRKLLPTSYLDLEAFLQSQFKGYELQDVRQILQMKQGEPLGDHQTQIKEYYMFFFQILKNNSQCLQSFHFFESMGWSLTCTCQMSMLQLFFIPLEASTGNCIKSQLRCVTIWQLLYEMT